MTPEQEQVLTEAIVSMQDNAARIQNALYREGQMYKNALMQIVNHKAEGMWAEGYFLVKVIANEAIKNGEFIAEIQ